MDFSPAEMLYGSSLRIPGEFLSPQQEQSHIEYVQQLQSFVQTLKPTPIRKHPHAQFMLIGSFQHVLMFL